MAVESWQFDRVKDQVERLDGEIKSLKFAQEKRDSLWMGLYMGVILALFITILLLGIHHESAHETDMASASAGSSSSAAQSE